MKKARFLMFDFDGTLVDTVADIAHHANTVLKASGWDHPRSREEVRAGVGWGVHELLKSLVPADFWGSRNLDGAVEEFKRLYSLEPVLNTRAYPGVLEMLEGPLSRYPKAILTNKPHALTVSILQKLGMTRYFNEVLGEGIGFPRKPDPAGAFHLMSRFGAGSEDTVLVGDSAVDQETARNAGIRFVWMDYGYDDRPRKDKSVFRLSYATDWPQLCAA